MKNVVIDLKFETHNALKTHVLVISSNIWAYSWHINGGVIFHTVFPFLVLPPLLSQYLSNTQTWTLIRIHILHHSQCTLKLFKLTKVTLAFAFKLLQCIHKIQKKYWIPNEPYCAFYLTNENIHINKNLNQINSNLMK